MTPICRFDLLSALRLRADRDRTTPTTVATIAGLLLAVTALPACGTDSTNANAGSVNCQVGEVVKLDSAGNKYCAPVGGDGGTINTDGGSIGTADGAGGSDGGGGGGDAAVGDGGAGGDGASAGDGAAAGDGSADAEDAGPKDPWWMCPPVKGTGSQHGKKCSTNEECMYGYCMKGGFLTGYDDKIAYCTKNNACTGDGSFTTAPCDYDDDAAKSLYFKSAFEKSKSSGNDKRTAANPNKVCARVCKSDNECASWNDEMPHCITSSTKYVSIGTQGVCGFDPTR